MIFLALKWNNFGFTSIGGKIVIGKSNQETFIKQIQTPMDIKEEIQIQIQTCTDWMVNFEKRNQESSPVTAFSKCKGCQQFPNDLFSFQGLQCALAFFWHCVSLSSWAIEIQIQTQMQIRNTNMKGVNISTQEKYKCTLLPLLVLSPGALELRFPTARG